jgi:hypothetical protein
MPESYALKHRPSHRRATRRPGRRMGVLSILTIGFVLIAGPASATVVAWWHMDEGPGARTMVDSSATGVNNGTIIGTVNTGVSGLVSGTAYQFTGRSSYVEVPDVGDSLDPFSQNMSITATVRTFGGVMPEDSYDLVRKGVTTTAGGMWKMEIKRGSGGTLGKLNCVFKGVMPDGKRVAVAKMSNLNLNDGLTHTVKCIKTATSVQAVVDGRVYTKTQSTGWINNSMATIVGAKAGEDDFLHGTLDEVIIDIG